MDPRVHPCHFIRYDHFRFTDKYHFLTDSNADICLSGVSNAKITRFSSAVWLPEIMSFLPARRYASTGLCDSDVSVRTSVCHTPVLCLAERKQDREMYTSDSPMTLGFWEGMTRWKIRKGSPQRNVPNEGVGFFGDFRPICRHISKTVHFRHKVTMGW